MIEINLLFNGHRNSPTKKKVQDGIYTKSDWGLKFPFNWKALYEKHQSSKYSSMNIQIHEPGLCQKQHVFL